MGSPNRPSCEHLAGPWRELVCAYGVPGAPSLRRDEGRELVLAGIGPRREARGPQNQSPAARRAEVPTRALEHALEDERFMHAPAHRRAFGRRHTFLTGWLTMTDRDR